MPGLQLLASLCPRTVLKYLLNDGGRRLEELEDPLVMNPQQSVLMWIDVAGFTKVAESLNPEALGRGTSEYFSKLIDIIDSYGGDVLKFCGDALMVAFTDLTEEFADDGLEALLDAAVVSACLCALKIQEVRYRIDSGSLDDGGNQVSFDLRVKVSVSLGETHAMLVGGVSNRWEYLVVGEPLQQIRAADASCVPGQVVLSASVAERLRRIDQSAKLERLSDHPDVRKMMPAHSLSMEESTRSMSSASVGSSSDHSSMDFLPSPPFSSRSPEVAAIKRHTLFGHLPSASDASQSTVSPIDASLAPEPELDIIVRSPSRKAMERVEVAAHGRSSRPATRTLLYLEEEENAVNNTSIPHMEVKSARTDPRKLLEVMQIEFSPPVSPTRVSKPASSSSPVAHKPESPIAFFRKQDSTQGFPAEHRRGSHRRGSSLTLLEPGTGSRLLLAYPDEEQFLSVGAAMKGEVLEGERQMPSGEGQERVIRSHTVWADISSETPADGDDLESRTRQDPHPSRPVPFPAPFPVSVSPVHHEAAPMVFPMAMRGPVQRVRLATVEAGVDHDTEQTMEQQPSPQHSHSDHRGQHSARGKFRGRRIHTDSSLPSFNRISRKEMISSRIPSELEAFGSSPEVKHEVFRLVCMSPEGKLRRLSRYPVETIDGKVKDSPLMPLVPTQLRSLLERIDRVDRTAKARLWESFHLLKHVTVIFVKIHSITENSFRTRDASGPGAAMKTTSAEYLELERKRGEMLADAVHEALVILETSLESYGGMLRQMTCDDKGTVAIGVFGVPNLDDGFNKEYRVRRTLRSDDAAYAVLCAMDIQRTLKGHAYSYASSIGVSTGGAYCGIIGSELRAEYAIVGDTVNTAARIAGKTDPTSSERAVACDRSTKELCQGSHLVSFDESYTPSVMVKNKVLPLVLHYPLHVDIKLGSSVNSQRWPPDGSKRSDAPVRFHSLSALPQAGSVQRFSGGNLVCRDLEKRIVDSLVRSPNSVASHDNQVILFSGPAGCGRSALFRFAKDSVMPQPRFHYHVEVRKAKLGPGLLHSVYEQLLGLSAAEVDGKETGWIARRLVPLFRRNQLDGILPFLELLGDVFPKTLSALRQESRSYLGDASVPESGSVERKAALCCLLVAIAQMRHTLEPFLLSLDDVHLLCADEWHWLTLMMVGCAMRDRELLSASVEADSLKFSPLARMLLTKASKSFTESASSSSSSFSLTTSLKRSGKSDQDDSADTDTDDNSAANEEADVDGEVSDGDYTDGEDECDDVVAPHRDQCSIQSSVVEGVEQWFPPSSIQYSEDKESYGPGHGNRRRRKSCSAALQRPEVLNRLQQLALSIGPDSIDDEGNPTDPGVGSEQALLTGKQHLTLESSPQLPEPPLSCTSTPHGRFSFDQDPFLAASTAPWVVSKNESDAALNEYVRNFAARFKLLERGGQTLMSVLMTACSTGDSYLKDHQLQVLRSHMSASNFALRNIIIKPLSRADCDDLARRYLAESLHAPWPWPVASVDLLDQIWTLSMGGVPSRIIDLIRAAVLAKIIFIDQMPAPASQPAARSFKYVLSSPDSFASCLSNAPSPKLKGRGLTRLGKSIAKGLKRVYHSAMLQSGDTE